VQQGGTTAVVWSFAAAFPAAMARMRSAGSPIWVSTPQNIHVVWLRPGRPDLLWTDTGTVATRGLSGSSPRSSRKRRKTPAHKATTTSLTVTPNRSLTLLTSRMSSCV
jgi:hypothetical protein